MSLDREETLFLLIDMQEKFAPAISGFDRVAGRCSVLLRSLNLLGVPVLVTEQYPKGLGKTVPLLSADLGNAEFFEKSSFSCFDSETVTAGIRRSGKKNIILAGIESHICVLQTAMDAQKSGYEVWLASDAVSSRHDTDRDSALAYMLHRGIHVLPVESLIFLLLGTSADPNFRAVQKIIING